MSSASPPVLEVSGLNVDLPGAHGTVRIVDDVAFTLAKGTTTGLIGESGSGKTMTALAILGLLPDGAQTSGAIAWQGENLLEVSDERRRKVRGREIAMVFQDPMASLNPSQTIGRQIGEILRRGGMPRRQVNARVLELMERVGIPTPGERIDDYPHEYSGGMRQRALIALALAGGPGLLLADEPTTALDVTVQARILRLLRSLAEDDELSMLLVTHDLRVMSHVAGHLVVMYAGRVAESGATADVLGATLHPYTRALIESVPAVETKSAIAAPLPGAPASPANRPSGCPFHPRCPMAQDICETEQPPLRDFGNGHRSACHFAEEVS